RLRGQRLRHQTGGRQRATRLHPALAGRLMTDIDTQPTDAPPTETQPTVTRLAATVERLRAEIARAQAAADGRALVEMAKGVLVERLRCGPAHAARQLDALAEQAGVTPLELAAELVNQAA